VRAHVRDTTPRARLSSLDELSENKAHEKGYGLEDQGSNLDWRIQSPQSYLLDDLPICIRVGSRGIEPEWTESSKLDAVHGGLRPERSEGAPKAQCTPPDRLRTDCSALELKARGPGRSRTATVRGKNPLLTTEPLTRRSHRLQTNLVFHYH
jgi:hypothetical protein